MIQLLRQAEKMGSKFICQLTMLKLQWIFIVGCVGRTVIVRSNGRVTFLLKSIRRRFSTLRMIRTAGSIAFQLDILAFVIDIWLVLALKETTVNLPMEMLNSVSGKNEDKF